MLRQRDIAELYFGETTRAIRFQSWMLWLDIVLIGFFAVSPFIEKGPVFLIIDFSIAALLAADLALRAWGYGSFRAWIIRPIVLADLAVLASLVLTPIFGLNLGFLRILRAYSLINGHAFWRTIGRGKWHGTPTEDTAKAAANLFVFIFMMTALVHTGFAARVPQISSYMDSLYFTVTSLTTTGYGDITLPGFWGKLTSIVIMIGGVSLFFRFIQVLMRPHKVSFSCHACGLLRHDYDASHCKACGAVLRIPNDNE
jgi:voltage-gated potassium channel